MTRGLHRVKLGPGYQTPYFAPNDTPPEQPANFTLRSTLGIFDGDITSWTTAQKADLKGYEGASKLGRPLTGPIVAYAGKGQGTWSEWRNRAINVLNTWTGRKSTNALHLALSPWPAADGSHTLALAAANASDAYGVHWQWLGEQIALKGYKINEIIVRPAWEFNINVSSFPWNIFSGGAFSSTKADQYAAMFALLTSRMRTGAGFAVKTDWCPLHRSMTAAQIEQAYPGNDSVTYIGMDVYDVDGSAYSDTSKNYSLARDRLYGVSTNTTSVTLQWQKNFATARGKKIGWAEYGPTYRRQDVPPGKTSGNESPYSTYNTAGFIDYTLDWAEDLLDLNLLEFICFFEYDETNAGAHRLYGGAIDFTNHRTRWNARMR